MKTVQELADEYAEKNLQLCCDTDEEHYIDAYIAGYNKAKEFIDPEKELPDEGINIIIEVDIFNSQKSIKVSGQYVNDKFMFDIQALEWNHYKVVGWRYID